MKKSCLFKKSALAAIIALASQQALAAGFQLNSQSATGLGRAFAGDAVIADNASVMAKNAAAMALFDETALSLGVVSIKTMIEVKDAEYTATQLNGSFQPVGSSTTESNYNNAGSTSYAPNLHLIVPLDDKFSVGINAYTNFGTRTEFGDSFAGKEYGGETEILSMNFGTSASYRIDDQWSLGAGIDFIYGKGTMKRTLSNAILPGENRAVDIDSADGWGIGFNLGTVYELDENNRFGASYRYSPEIDAEDDKGQKITLPLPDMAEISGYHRVQNTKFAIHYSAQWIGWSRFDKITFEDLTTSPAIAPSDKAYNWKDAYHLSLGTTYYLNNTWILRAGYMFDESAQDKTTSISVPDSDRHWLSTGFTYNITDKSNIDFGFTYLIGSDVDVEENGKFSSIKGTTHADAILMGLQYSQTF